MQKYDFQRYLNAKKTVDDRALNAMVWSRLGEEINLKAKKLDVLEIGMGTGTMLERMLESRILVRGAYTGLDAQAENIRAAQLNLAKWSAQLNLVYDPVENFIRLRGDGVEIKCRFISQDLYDFMDGGDQNRQWDLLMANAFLDLVDASATLPRLAGLLRPGGLAYFSINFDGLSIFEPVIDAHLDTAVLDAYHNSMDCREGGGSSQTGRKLFSWLREAGFQLLAAGASDWVVFPGPDGYNGDEKYFLRHILHFVEDSLQNHPDLPQECLQEWLALRRQQLEKEELVYIAHQIDFLARV